MYYTQWGNAARTKPTVLWMSGYNISVSKLASERHSNCDDLAVRAVVRLEGRVCAKLE